MNVNVVLIALIGFVAIFTLLRGLFAPTPYARGWSIVAALTLGIMIISFFFNPETAGYTGGGIWLVFVLVPIAIAKRANALVYKQKYRQARQLALIVKGLHPADGWREQPDLLKAMELGKQGNIAEAAQILERYQNIDTPLKNLATIQLYRIQGRWEELLAWFKQQFEQPGVQKNPAHLTLYLLTLGETGHPNELLQNYKQFEPIISRISQLNVTSYLYIFAYCGETEHLAKLLNGTWRVLSEPAQNFWLATANFAARNPTQAREHLAIALESDDALLQNSIRRRQSFSLPHAATILTPESQSILAQIKREFEQAQRFGRPLSAAPKRAYVTYSLIALNIIVFALELAQGSSQNQQTLYNLGALVPAEIIYTEQWWRLFTSTVLHYGWLHLILNMAALYILGPFTEWVLGRLKFLIIYLCAGVGAAAMIVLLFVLQFNNGYQLLVGASGGIMGLVGAAAAILLRGWRVEKAKIASRQLGFIITIIIFQILFDLTVPQISGTSHLAGLVIGFVLTSLMPHRRSEAGRG